MAAAGTAGIGRLVRGGGSCNGEEKECGARSMGGIEMGGRGKTWWEDNAFGNSMTGWVPCLINHSL